MNALQEGQAVIESLRENASVEQFEEILEQQEETKAQEEELRQMVNEAGIDDSEIQEDLDKLEAELFGGEIDQVEVPKDQIKAEYVSYTIDSPYLTYDLAMSKKMNRKKMSLRKYPRGKKKLQHNY